ncbi:hypothetical protein [Nocardia asiatica]|uniref:hypothetical protein n=1 Tax=Nocardia asiatica TaxID=209252 RepID=UPI002453AEB1|nr:hypothetical protein [Nocardia asiatica]
MPDTTEDDDPQHIRPFAEFFADLRRGAPHEEASAALHDLIAAVKETRKSGRLTITFEIGINKGTDMVLIKDAVATRLPRLDRPHSLWFVDGDGNPTRHDPTQLQFDVAAGVRVITPGKKKA